MITTLQNIESIPIFPSFQKLDISSKKIIVDYCNKYPPYSDFNFVSLWGYYNTDNDVLISCLFGNLVVRFTDHDAHQQFYSFLGTNKTIETAKILIDLSQKNNMLPFLKFIPEIVVKSDNRFTETFSVNEDRDNFDYILSTDEISALETSKFYNHRRAISRFVHKNPNFQIKSLDLSDPKVHEEVISLFKFWEKAKHKGRDETKHELKALKRTLSAADFLNLTSLGIYKELELIGYVIADLENKNCAEIHFLKYNPLDAGIYKGMNHILHHFFAVELKKVGIEMINIEQDTGLLNLRIAKEHCKPIAYLKKYTVAPK